MSLIPSFFGGRRSSIFDPISLDIWDPFEGLGGGPTAAMTAGAGSQAAAMAGMRMDWKETENAHVFMADIPGLKKEEVKVEVEDGNVLKISGERRRQEEEKTDRWHRIERSSGAFLRRFRLPDNAKVDQVRASIETGVLTVTIPKEDVKKKPLTKSIDISG